MPADTPWLAALIGTSVVALITAAGGVIGSLTTRRTEKEKTGLETWRSATERLEKEVQELREQQKETDARVWALLDKVDDLDHRRRLYRRHILEWREAFPEARERWPPLPPLLTDEMGD